MQYTDVFENAVNDAPNLPELNIPADASSADEGDVIENNGALMDVGWCDINENNTLPRCLRSGHQRGGV